MNKGEFDGKQKKGMKRKGNERAMGEKRKEEE